MADFGRCFQGGHSTAIREGESEVACEGGRERARVCVREGRRERECV